MTDITIPKAKKQIAILGSTGSIGTQTLDIVRNNPEKYQVTVITAGRNVDRLIEQAREFRPALAVIADEVQLPKLKEALSPLGIECRAGADALADAMERDDFSTVVTATVGYSGLAPTIRAIKAGKDIALANKETLVAAGQLVNQLLADSPSKVYPVDSEHSAIYQCLQGENKEAVSRLIITASGGPFRGFTKEQLEHVTVSDALKHPNWHMGAKITIDSATMMNKAFEIIEARWLFDMPGSKISAVVHPQSIVHSMVEFIDGGIKAQLGVPDMHLPIAYALGEGTRIALNERLNLTQLNGMTFELPDFDVFPCLSFAYKCLDEGGNMACVVNAANEVAVFNFLCGNIRYNQIYPLIEKTIDAVPFIQNPTYEDIVATNNEARAKAEELIKNMA